MWYNTVAFYYVDVCLLIIDYIIDVLIGQPQIVICMWNYGDNNIVRVLYWYSHTTNVISDTYSINVPVVLFNVSVWP